VWAVCTWTLCECRALRAVRVSVAAPSVAALCVAALCVAALCVAAPKSRHLAARVEVISVVRALGVEAVRICASEAFHKLHVEGGLPRQLHSRQWKRRHRGAIL